MVAERDDLFFLCVGSRTNTMVLTDSLKGILFSNVIEQPSKASIWVRLTIPPSPREFNQFIAALLQTVAVLVGKWFPPSLCIFLNEEGIFQVFSMVQFWFAISHTFCTAENTCELFHIVFRGTQNVQCHNMSSSRGVNAQTWWYQLSQVTH